MKNLFITRRQLLPLVLVAPLFLSACAGTRVLDVASTAPVASMGTPHTVAIVIENDAEPAKKERHQAQQDADAQQSMTDLTDGLSGMLATHQLTVVPAGQPSDLVLHCKITAVRSGNEALRLTVGYGAGRAILRTDVTLDDASGNKLLSFETRSTTGAGKGPGMSLMDGGSAVTMVKAGIDGVRGTKKDLPHEIIQTTEHIDQELGKYFTSHQWPYPAPATDVARQG